MEEMAVREEHAKQELREALELVESLQKEIESLRQREAENDKQRSSEGGGGGDDGDRQLRQQVIDLQKELQEATSCDARRVRELEREVARLESSQAELDQWKAMGLDTAVRADPVLSFSSLVVLLTIFFSPFFFCAARLKT